MPNWCENHISFSGKPDEIQKFLEVIKDETSDCGYSLFEKLYPTPEELLDTVASIGSKEEMSDQQKNNVEKYGHADWYDWRISNWGTKWTESELRLEQELYTSRQGISTIAFGFETAWGPAIELFDKVTKDYPNILICLYYEEPGMGFCGTNVWANGSSMQSQESELISSHFDEDYLYSEAFGTK